MAFDSYGAGKNEGKKKFDVDWEAYHNYIIETAGLESREVIPGVITGILDAGTQELPDAEVTFTGDDEAEATEIEKNPNTYFKDGFDQQTRKPARLKCWPNKPQQCVMIAVDFPDIQLQLGQFFGDPEAPAKPLRMILGGEFYMDGIGKIVARPTPLKITKASGVWSFDSKNFFHKAAVAAKLIKPTDPFLPKQIDQLLGVTLNFDVQLYMKENKGKSYMTEYIKFVSGLTRGQKALEYDGKLTLVQFNQENDVEALKELRSTVRNTMKRASNYEGSKLQEQLEELFSSKESSQDKEEPEDKPEPPAAKPKVAPVVKAKKKVEVPDDLDESAPF